MEWLGARHSGENALTFGGGRASYSGLESAANNSNRVGGKFTSTWNLIQDRINATRSPVKRVAGSRMPLFLFDGTSNSLDSQTLVSRMFSLSRETTFYYGGIGNPVDYGGFGQATGWQYERIVQLALDDAAAGGYKEVNVMGFSRGAGQSVLFAEEAKKRGITVNFLGLWDPVISRTLPGTWSWYVIESDLVNGKFYSVR